MKIKNFIIFSTAITLVLASSLAVAASRIRAQEIPPLTTVAQRIEIEFDNIHRNDLYDYVSNFENDNNYWPGVIDAYQTQEGDKNEIGAEYVHAGFFNGFPFETYVTVIDGKKKDFLYHEGVGLISYSATYTFETDDHNSSRLIVESTVTTFGATPELMNAYFLATYTNLQAELDTSGNIEIVYSYFL